jgi:2',3'-cyclic-nucleotide 2'-phosphodiesterase (5'-nucleotidase family)
MSAKNLRGPRLRIVAVNDVYVLDALPSLAGLVEHARTVDPADVLLVTLAGDFVAPSLLSSLDSGAGMVDTMNAVGFTHVCFGNHEDDIEPSELSARVRELRAKCLGTNVRGFDPELPVSDVVVVGARGEGARAVKVGLVGVVLHDRTVYRRAPFGGVTLLPANESALAERDRLVAAGCDSVIALTHQPVGDDLALARARPPVGAFPVILGGHEHQAFLANEGGTTVVKAAADAVRAAVVDLEWPASGEGPPTVRVVLEDVRKYPERPEIRAKVDAHMKRVHELASAILLVVEPGQELSSLGTRSRQTTMGTLLASRVRAALGADVCIFNGGGIRAAKTYQGTFSYGDLQAEVPFENEMVVVPIPGRVLSDAVRSSRERAGALGESGGFLQVCDRTTVAPDGRVTHLAGEPLEENKSYRVALVRNLFAGMDQVMPLVAFAEAHPERICPPGSGRDVKLVLLESFAHALWSNLGGFAHVDGDGDGMVTHDELTSAITGYTRKPPSDVAAGIVLRSMDEDHDEKISPAEAARVVRAKPSDE